jgi:hypothetical protein
MRLASSAWAKKSKNANSIALALLLIGAVPAIKGQFEFASDQWNIVEGSPGACEGLDCQKYACTNKPDTPFCRGCSGNPSVYNVDPEDCLESDPNKRCSDCLKLCTEYRTGWAVRHNLTLPHPFTVAIF